MSLNGGLDSGFRISRINITSGDSNQAPLTEEIFSIMFCLVNPVVRLFCPLKGDMFKSTGPMQRRLSSLAIAEHSL